MKQRLPDNLSGSWGVTLSQVATKFARKCVPSWDTFILARIRNSRQLVGDFLTAHGKVGPSWPNFYRHQSRQLPDKLSWSWGSKKGANFCSSWTEVNGGQIGHHFTVVVNQLLVNLTRSYLWPWWSQVIWIWNFRPSWAEVNNVDQVGPHYSHL